MRFFYLIYIPAVRPVAPSQPLPETTTATANISDISDTAEDTDTAVLPVVPTIPPLKIEIPNIKNDVLSINNNSEDKNVFGSSKKHREPKNEDNNNFKINKTVKFALEAIDKSEKELLRSQQKLTSKLESVNKAIAYEYKIKNNDSLQSSSNSDNCVYDYTEPDKDEIKAFAERRDREWALQKYADSEVHVSKKRKKSKHSKSEFNIHKKRKLHAEITSNTEFSSKSDDSLKLKVKLSVANGHKHKHRSSSNSNVEPSKPKSPELSPKERLLQMRQIRHKTVTNNSVLETDKKSPPLKLTLTTVADSKNEPLTPSQSVETPEKVQKPLPTENRASDILTSGKTLRSDFTFKTSISKDICNKFVRVNLEKCADGNKSNGAKKTPINSPTNKIDKQSKTEIFPLEKTNGNNKLNIVKNETINNKSSVNNLPNCRVNLKQENFKTADVTKLKPTEKETKNKDNSLTIKETNNKLNIKLINKPNNNIKLPVDNKTPQAQQKNVSKPPIDESKSIENKLNNIDFKNNSGTLVTKNFTVSKVETGVKRKLEVPETQDKRPSLEITVINLVSRSPQTGTAQTKPVTTNASASPQTSNSKPALSITPEGPPTKKIRPPPLTIPLGRIQKVGMKATAQKQSEKCDIFGALDLSAKPNTSTVNKNTKNKDSVVMRSQQTSGGSKTSEANKSVEKRPNISNLQLLSESAVQIREMMVKNSPTPTIPNLIKKVPVGGPQMQGSKTAEFLQMAQNFPGARSPNILNKNLNPQLAKNNMNKNAQFLPKNLQNLPKLNEINKSHFSRLNTSQQVRAPRPAGQNQTVRNIPNPSLLVRQQNQNRINSLNTTTTTIDTSGKTKQPASTGSDVPEAVEKTAGKTSEPPPLKPIESFKK